MKIFVNRKIIQIIIVVTTKWTICWGCIYFSVFHIWPLNVMKYNMRVMKMKMSVLERRLLDFTCLPRSESLLRKSNYDLLFLKPSVYLQHISIWTHHTAVAELVATVLDNRDTKCRHQSSLGKVSLIMKKLEWPPLIINLKQENMY